MTIPKVSEERASGRGPGPGPVRQVKRSWDRSQGSSSGGVSVWRGAAQVAAKGIPGPPPPPHRGCLSSSPASHLQAAGPGTGTGCDPASPAPAPASPCCTCHTRPGHPVHGRAHPAEPVEPAAAGAAPAGPQTGTGRSSRPTPPP